MATIISCIEDHPTPKTVQLGGVYVNLRQLARMTGVDNGYLSRMLLGKRDPLRMGLGLAMQIAGALGISIDDLIQALYDRQKKLILDRTKLELFKEFLDLQAARERNKLTKLGLPSPPPVPLTPDFE